MLKVKSCPLHYSLIIYKEPNDIYANHKMILVTINSIIFKHRAKNPTNHYQSVLSTHYELVCQRKAHT